VVAGGAGAIGAYLAVQPGAPGPKADASPPSVAQPPPAPTPPARLVDGAVFSDCAQCPQMVVIPSGTFWMGSESSEGFPDEWPRHRVTIPTRLALGKHEVTFAEWDACVTDGGCSHRPNDEGWGRGNRPVMNISWSDTQEYLNWLSRKTDKKYRLPSEAEWEYAARAGTETAFWWGGDSGRNNANCRGCGSEWDNLKTAPAGSFRPNPFGLHDTQGNVHEWVMDCYKGHYTEAPHDGSAWTGSSCIGRVYRGGGSATFPRELRSAARGVGGESRRDKWIGFRVARSLD
jgi:formylglycine-generating enzyme required for sulfatase activity